MAHCKDLQLTRDGPKIREIVHSINVWTSQGADTTMTKEVLDQITFYI